jgi:succinate dehydrogenase/fumarate reductase flavoprotein subunit
MNNRMIVAAGLSIPVVTCHTLVVGAGAAGLAAACHLKRLGVDDILVIANHLMRGTSRNTGSDKQTYYKLSLQGDAGDSVGGMAADLFAGGCVDGDMALCEAALSARCFFHLAEAGVPFPHNEYGEYVGYKTDHDPRNRATSAGPLTSKFMTEALMRKAKACGVAFSEGHTVAALLADGGRCHGVLTLTNKPERYAVILAEHTVYATGAPALMYLDSVYPQSQAGATGAALLAGVTAQNLSEWQYGLASTGFRWNLSGTYQQIVPRYVSVGEDGEPREFLRDHLADADIFTRTFLKGYEWPFDAKKRGGSSKIDLLVYEESRVKGRSVYLDYRQNPAGFGFDALSETARVYLENSGAVQDTPIARLRHMNEPAYQLYRSNGVDLENELLPTAVCAQHNNGGLSADHGWQSPVRGLYPVGEVCGSHGVTRPGGSALNAGQVGALRAAETIAQSTGAGSGRPQKDIPIHSGGITPPLQATLESAIARWEALLSRPGASNIEALDREAAADMSTHGAFMRADGELSQLAARMHDRASRFFEKAVIAGANELSRAAECYDTAVCRAVYSAAMRDAVQNGTGSRGGYLVLKDGGCMPENTDMRAVIQETQLKDGYTPVYTWRPVRPMPESDGWFERVWAKYREQQKG